MDEATYGLLSDAGLCNMSERRVAVLLAGGKGTRLRPFTAVFPKPLVPVGELPIIDILARQLVAAGFLEIVISVGHLAHLVEAYFVEHPLRRHNVSFSFVRESSPLGTAGPLAQIPGLPEHFLVLNGDILTDLDFGRMFQAHLESGANLTVATKMRSVQIQLGVIERRDNLITGYREKPRLEYEVSMGVYAYSQIAVGAIPHGRPFDFPDLVLKLIKQGQSVAAYPVDAEWLDIGNPDDYALAQDLVTANLDKYVCGKSLT